MRPIDLEAQTLPGHKKCRLSTYYIAKENGLGDFENFEFSPTYGLSIASQSLVGLPHCFSFSEPIVGFEGKSIIFL